MTKDVIGVIPQMTAAMSVYLDTMDWIAENVVAIFAWAMKHATVSMGLVQVDARKGILENSVMTLVAKIITAETVPMSVRRTAGHVDTQTDFALVKQVGRA